MIKLIKIEFDKNRIYGLDILRAIAILFVMLEHGSFLLPQKLAFIHKIIVFDGVSIFFVLSGFLIGGILIKLIYKNRPTIVLLFDFWVRRWFRTIPNYLLILVLLIVISFVNNEGVLIEEVKSYFFFAQNLFYPHPDFFPEVWSLSVEEWFYLITPICIFSFISIFKIESRHAVILISIMILLFTLSFRYYKFISIDINSISEWDITFRKQVFTRLDSLMFGLICAFIHFYYKNSWLKYKNKSLIIGLLIFAIFKLLDLFNYISPVGFYHCVLSFAVTSIATSFVLPYLSDIRSGKGILYQKLTKISLISYSMYLINLSVVQFSIVNKIHWESHFENNIIVAILKYATFWTLTLFFSIIIYKYYEVPVTKLREVVKVKKATITPNNLHIKISG